MRAKSNIHNNDHNNILPISFQEDHTPWRENTPITETYSDTSIYNKPYHPPQSKRITNPERENTAITETSDDTKSIMAHIEASVPRMTASNNQNTLTVDNPNHYLGRATS